MVGTPLMLPENVHYSPYPFSLYLSCHPLAFCLSFFTAESTLFALAVLLPVSHPSTVIYMSLDGVDVFHLIALTKGDGPCSSSDRMQGNNSCSIDGGEISDCKQGLLNYIIGVRERLEQDEGMKIVSDYYTSSSDPGA